MLEVFRWTSVTSFMVIGNSLHPAPRRKLENANDAWIALWSLTEKLRLKATDPVIAVQFLVGVYGSSELDLENLEVG